MKQFHPHTLKPLHMTLSEWYVWTYWQTSQMLFDEQRRGRPPLIVLEYKKKPRRKLSFWEKCRVSWRLITQHYAGKQERRTASKRLKKIVPKRRNSRFLL